MIVVGKNYLIFSGKGRYGKRPPSFTTEYAAPFIDSEDSGFGCDFHSSESQLSWSNDEAAKLVASTNSTSAIQQPIFSLTPRTPTTNNPNTTSSLSTSSSSTTSSFNIPQFSTSSPAEVSFCKNFYNMLLLFCALGNDWCGCGVRLRNIV